MTSCSKIYKPLTVIVRGFFFKQIPQVFDIISSSLTVSSSLSIFVHRIAAQDSIKHCP